MTRDRSSARHSSHIASVVVAAVAIATFGRGVFQPFVETWDDGRFLLQHADTDGTVFRHAQRVSWEGFVSIWTEPHFQAWHPLHLLSYWIDVPWSGPNATVVHSVSLALWVLALWLVLRAFRRLEFSWVTATIATLVYGIHPVQVEAVSWATGRKDILALLFSMAALLAHLSEQRYPTRASWQSSSARQRVRLVLRGSVPSLFYLLAVLSKTTALPLPLVLFLVDRLLCGVSTRQAIVRQVFSAAAGAVLAGVVVWIWADREMIRTGAAGGTAGGRVQLVAATLTHFVRTAIVPTDLSPVYRLYRGGDFKWWIWVGPALVLAAFAVAIRKRAWRPSFGLAAFLVFFLPVSNVVPVYFQYQDRYLSLPLWGFAFLAGLGLERLGAKRGSTRAALIGGLLVAALMTKTVAYQGVWSSDHRLWRHATETQPESFYAWMKLGEYYRDRGDFDEAVDAYRNAVEVRPDLRLVHAALFHAVTHRDEARRTGGASRAHELAERYYRALGDPIALRQLGYDLLDQGHQDAVILVLERSFELDPISDERLEQAAFTQLRNEKEWLARYYLSKMRRAPVHPALQALENRGRPR